MIKYAHEAGILTSTSTNGQLINEKIAAEIVLSGLDKIIISIDGTSQEVYEKYRIGGKLELALESIRHIQNWKNKTKSFTPLIEIQFIVLKHNEHQINEVKKMAKDLNVDFLKLKTAQLYDFKNGHASIPSLRKYSRYKKNNMGEFVIKSRLKNHCWRMWAGAVVTIKGEILPCCFDKIGEHTFGNISSNSFLSVWQNKKAHDFRKAVLNNRKLLDICKNCSEK
jgi:radical SAM protein with 4Fe4S-binding SPASM domain